MAAAPSLDQARSPVGVIDLAVSGMTCAYWNVGK